MIGAGGLGCPALQYLAAAGVGNIGIIDGDTVDETNLQRQVLFSTNDIGTPKVDAAKNRLLSLNPDIVIETYHENLTYINAVSVIRKYDVVIDGTDNFATRYLVNDTCVKLDKPFVYGAIHKFEGQVTVFNFEGGPTYRCLFPDPPAANQIPNCSEVGVLGVLPGIIGTYQASEAIKLILGIGETLSGKLKMVNLLNNSHQAISFFRSEDQVEKALAIDLQESYVDTTCSAVNVIGPDKLKDWLNEGKQFDIMDVRELQEKPRLESGNVICIPLGQISERLLEIPKTRPLVVICQHGIRSQQAIELLKNNNYPNELINLEGGMAAFM